MKKNVASQKVGAQMVSASDGSAFTSAVTVHVTLDAGSQAQGTVGSGACTHEGNGYHTYAPAQAETNGDLVAFTFVGSGAVPATVQIYTSFPQTGDSYAEVTSGSHGLAVIEAQTDDIGAAGAGLTAITSKTDNLPSDPADASVVAGLIAGVDAKIDIIDTNVDSILVDTAEIGAAGAGLTNINLPDQTMNIIGNITGNLSGSVGSVTGLTAADVAAIKAKTDNLPSDPADASVVAGLIAAVEAKVDIIDTNVDSVLADTGTDGVVVAAASKTGYALSATGSAAFTEGYAALGAAGTLPQILYEIRALLAEKSISSTTLTTKKLDGSTTAATYTLDDDTTPSAITRAS